SRDWSSDVCSSDLIDYMLETFQSREAVSQQIENGYQYFIIKNADEEEVGYTAVKPEDGRLFLSKLYVLKVQRGKGYGSSALAAIKQLAQDQSYTAIWRSEERRVGKECRSRW